jgi:hypothetical protein
MSEHPELALVWLVGPDSNPDPRKQRYLVAAGGAMKIASLFENIGCAGEAE